ncbi:MAG: Na+-transporting NADH:ubiquinone oxidoreductase subunit D [Bacteroidetes bacterium]|nr:MAG: Na+-transporting NADH:ubiquinone oxidoreductase subunit D [Bacteroidota bacterium]PIE88766.1 MAG: Na+-transporting NADH:ubiquinone oxidoreductase subunit D [Bacteroidota bacterium]
MSLLRISGSPHVHGDQSVSKIMLGVIIALIPAVLVSLYFYGLGALRVLVLAVGASMLFEFLIQKYLLKGAYSLSDFSAMLTGVLLALNVPSSLPWYMVVIGALVAIGIGKMSFGGLGNNLFNPALVGRVFLLVSFPVQMTTWPKAIVARSHLFFNGVDQGMLDTVTGATPLGHLAEQGVMQDPAYMDYLIGSMGGSLGEISAIALLLGGIYMLFKKIITWEIPVAFLGSAALLSGIFWLVDPTQYADPLFHLITGGMLLGAIFMATDMVTSPMSRNGQIVFGIGGGVLTILIRIWGAYPEGVSFAILIMNAFVPLIDRAFKPKLFGEVVKNG